MSPRHHQDRNGQCLHRGGTENRIGHRIDGNSDLHARIAEALALHHLVIPGTLPDHGGIEHHDLRIRQLTALTFEGRPVELSPRQRRDGVTPEGLTQQTHLLGVHASTPTLLHLIDQRTHIQGLSKPSLHRWNQASALNHCLNGIGTGEWKVQRRHGIAMAGQMSPRIEKRIHVGVETRGDRHQRSRAVCGRRLRQVGDGADALAFRPLELKRDLTERGGSLSHQSRGLVSCKGDRGAAGQGLEHCPLLSQPQREGLREGQHRCDVHGKPLGGISLQDIHQPQSSGLCCTKHQSRSQPWLSDRRRLVQHLHQLLE